VSKHDARVNGLKNCGSLEAWMKKQRRPAFPDISPDEKKTYAIKYFDLKDALLPLHKVVGLGATIKDHNVHLNRHDERHVEKVIERVYELLINFSSGLPSAFEVFLLLCAVQLHDIGNITGRREHEKKIKEVTYDELKPIIPDTLTQKYIYDIAGAHGGSVDGGKDTLSRLQQHVTVHNQLIRPALLAAVLRFADELADGPYRAYRKLIDLDLISEESRIHHCYSTACHTTHICQNEINNTLFPELIYHIDKDVVGKRFNVEGDDRTLIDEIFSRTAKAERERRYCMRYFGHHLALREIRVKIDIESDTPPRGISYTLKEEGYPADEVDIKLSETVSDILRSNGWAKLDEKGWKLQNE